MYDPPVDEREGRNRLLKHNENGRVWLIAWLLTLALHAVLVLVFQKLPPLQAAPATTAKPEPIQLVFTQPAPDTHTSEEPQFFSELPADRADTAPEKPQFLSNVTSRARDQVPGGDTDLPRLEGEADAPMVRLAPGGSPSPPSATSPPAPHSSDAAAGRAAESQQRGGSQPAPAGSAEPSNPSGEPLTPVSDEELRGESGQSVNQQPEMVHPQGNASLLGDVSLNTIAWDYAPWLQRFIQQLRERWYAPPAYTLGILKEGGWALVEVEISKSGKLLRFDLLEEQGHPSLIRSAQNAVRSMSPIEKLPADFPEPTLVLRIRMIYPKFRTR